MAQNLKTVTLIFALASLAACNKSDNEVVKVAPATQSSEYAASISKVKEHYQIDTLLILGNRNKKQLLQNLQSQTLQEIKNVQEIPDFIRAFLDSNSVTKTFEMANPNQDWQPGDLPVFEFRKTLVKPEKNSTDSVFITMLLPKKMPRQQLAYFAIGNNIAVLAHYYGGSRKMEQISIFKFEGTQIVDFWFDNDCEFATEKEKILKYLSRPKPPKVYNSAC